MKHSGSAWLVLFTLLAALGAGCWFLLSRTPATIPDAGSGTTLAGDEAPSAASLPSTARASDGRGRESVARRTDAALRKSPALADPEYAQHLGGFTGRVLAADGTPAAACVVRIFQRDLAEFGHGRIAVPDATTPPPELELGATTTDAEGRFTILGAEPAAEFVLTAGGGERWPWTFRMLQSTPLPGELVDLGDFRLRESVTVTGLVVGPDQAPLAGALVRSADLPGALLAVVPVERFDPEGHVIQRNGELHEMPCVFAMPPWVKACFEQIPLPSTRTGSDGRFELRGVDLGANTLVVTHAGLASFVNPALRTKSGQTKDVGTVTLSEGESAIGKVVDVFGKPVPRAEVLVAQTSAQGSFDFAGQPVRCDAEGRFRVPGFRAGQVTVAARRTPGDPFTVQAPAPVASDLVAKLPASATLRLAIRHEANRALKALRVRLLAASPRFDFLGLGLVPEIPLAERRDDSVPGMVTLRDLPLGRYLLAVEAEECASTMGILTLEKDMEHTVVLRGEQTLPILVVDSESRPVRRALVHTQCTPKEAAPGDWYASLLRDPVHRVGTTDAEGRLVARIASDAVKVTISVRHPRHGHGHAEVTLPSREVTIRLLAPGRLEGVLTDSGRVPTPGDWSIEVQRAWFQGQVWGVLPDADFAVTPDAAGRFAIAKLPPGTYTARSVRSLAAVHSAKAVYEEVLGPGQHRWLEPQGEVFKIESGRTTSIQVDTDGKAKQVDGPAGTLRGSVTIDGKPGEGLVLMGWNEGQLRAKVDASGRFDFGRVRAGNLHMSLLDPSSKAAISMGLWSGNCKVEAEQVKNLDIVLETGGIEGHVRDASGAPVANAHVMAFAMLGSVSPDGSGSSYTNAAARTDPEGRFAFTRLPAASYQVRVAVGNEQRASVFDQKVTPGAKLTGVDLVLQRVFTLAGRIEFEGLTTPPAKDAEEQAWGMLEPANTRGPTRHIAEGFQLELPSGKFHSQGVLPGTYHMTVDAHGKSWRSALPLSVTNSDQKDLLVRLVPSKPEAKDAATTGK